MGHRSPHLVRPACFTTARACGLFLFSPFEPHAATAAPSQPPRLGRPPRPASPPARLPLPLSAAEAATGRQRPSAPPPVTAAPPPPVLGQPPRRADAAAPPFPFPALPEAASAAPARPVAAAPPPAARGARRRPPWITAAAPPKPPPSAPPDAASRTLTARWRDHVFNHDKITQLNMIKNKQNRKIKFCVRAREKMAEVPPPPDFFFGVFRTFFSARFLRIFAEISPG
jgi:hypothetical protein